MTQIVHILPLMWILLYHLQNEIDSKKCYNLMIFVPQKKNQQSNGKNLNQEMKEQLVDMETKNILLNKISVNESNGFLNIEDIKYGEPCYKNYNN